MNLEQVYKRLERRKVHGNPAGGTDGLTALLGLRLSDLREPLEVQSTILGETIWLVANDRQAAAIQAKGGTAYTPEEVAILREMYAAVTPEVWSERLKLIHLAKKHFQGTLEQ